MTVDEVSPLVLEGVPTIDAAEFLSQVGLQDMPLFFICGLLLCRGHLHQLLYLT